jgi:hypothetical protein
MGGGGDGRIGERDEREYARSRHCSLSVTCDTDSYCDSTKSWYTFAHNLHDPEKLVTLGVSNIREITRLYNKVRLRR